MSNNLLKTALLASTIFAGAAFSAPALAQVPAEASPEVADAVADDAADEETVVITGTRIARPNLEQSSPVSVIGEDQIQLQQPVSAEELLREVPGQLPSLNQNVNNGGSGSAFINLRGLGSNRNLILMDGNRVVPADLVGRVNLNIIPLALIERVDVFTGGASTVYGADAVAGVVNFITKRDFAGIDINLGTGITQEGDGAIAQAAVTIGANFDDGRGNAVVSFGYSDTDPVYEGQRPFSLTAFGSGTGAPQGSNTSVPLSIRNGGAASRTQLDTNTGLFVDRYNTFNTNPLNLIQTPLNRFNIYAKGNYQITDSIEAFVSGFYSKSKVLFNAAPSGIFGNVVAVPVSNPFIPTGARAQLCANVDTNPNIAGTQLLTAAECTAATTALTPTDPNYREFLLTADRRFAEGGPRVTTYNFNTFQMNGGLRGPLTPTLDWELSGSYGESSRVQSALGAGFDKAQQALRATNPTTCTVATNGCVPLNIFGPQGSITPAMLNFVALTAYNFVDTTLSTGQATISGDLGVAMPWAHEAIGVATGVEYRRYRGFSRGDAISAVPGAILGGGAAALPQRGEYDSKEAFAELIIPIIEDKPFFHNLTLEVGGRVSDYSLSGVNWTYKAGGSWSPIEDIKFRGMYSKAVRAPNLAELFQPQVVALSNLTFDPCQGQIQNAAAANYNARLANEAALRTLCVATGVPANVIGTGQIPAPSSGQIQTTQGGNPNLDPETAKTITAGVVIQPRMVPGLSMTLDWYDIKVNGAISAPAVPDIINGCYTVGLNPTLSPSAQACALILRQAGTGRLDGEARTTPGVQLVTTNQGYIATRGWDIGINYRRDLGFARLNLAFNGNRTDNAYFQASPQGFIRECTGFYSGSCQPLQFKYTWTLRTTLTWMDGIDTSFLWRHQSSARLEPDNACPTPGVNAIGSCGPGAGNIFDAYESIPAYDWFDASLRAPIGDHFTFIATVTNIFNKKPPFVGNTIGTTAFNHANTFPSNYDAVGRRFNVGVNLRW